MNHKQLEEYILSMQSSWLDYPFGTDVAVYKVGGAPGDDPKKSKMFALISLAKVPLQISLKCDPALSIVLQEKYEEVMPGYHLNKKHWITAVLTGQLSEEDIKGLIHHSYLLATGQH